MCLAENRADYEEQALYVPGVKGGRHYTIRQVSVNEREKVAFANS
jgi:hypothetical protein